MAKACILPHTRSLAVLCRLSIDFVGEEVMLGQIYKSWLCMYVEKRGVGQVVVVVFPLFFQSGYNLLLVSVSISHNFLRRLDRCYTSVSNRIRARALV